MRQLPVFSISAALLPSRFYLQSLFEDELTVHRDINNNLKQVWTGSTLVDFRDTSGTREMYIFEKIPTPNIVAGLFVPPSYATAKIIIKCKILAAGGFSIEQTNRGITEYAEYVPVDTSTTWKIRRGSLGTNLEEQENTTIFLKNVSNLWEKYKTTKVRREGKLVSHAAQTLIHYEFGEKLISDRQYVNETSTFLETNYSYYTNATERIRYGNIKTIRYPDGKWVVRDYTGSTWPGKVRR